MKKLILLPVYLCLFLLTSPIFAQVDEPADPGADPEPLPIDSSIWILIAIGLIFVFIKTRAYIKQA